MSITMNSQSAKNIDIFLWFSFASLFTLTFTFQFRYKSRYEIDVEYVICGLFSSILQVIKITQTFEIFRNIDLMM